MASNIFISDALVLFDPVRSAEPPTNSGIWEEIWLITISEDWRVALAIFLFEQSFLNSFKILLIFDGSFPLILLTYSFLEVPFILLVLDFHFLYLPIERVPAINHSLLILSGISNGLYSQFNWAFVSSISSRPKGAPWADDLPCLFGEPKPILVLQAINVGLLDFWALEIAFDIWFWSCPLIDIVFHWYALKRLTVFSEFDKLTGPSIEIPLSSKKTINFFNFRWPARDAASWLIPSIKSPSLAIT